MNTEAELLQGAGRTFHACLAYMRNETANGSTIDEHQVRTRRLSALATRLEAAKSLLAYGEACEEAGQVDGKFASMVARVFCAEVAMEVHNEAKTSFIDAEKGAGSEHYGLSAELWDYARSCTAESEYREVGIFAIDSGGENGRWIHSSGSGDDEQDLRNSTRRFARSLVAPKAEEIHRGDLLVPEEIIEQMAGLGYFGMSVPLDYGGVGMSNLMMILATEELSAASLSSAGSLITRPEILCKALLKGGTEAQKSIWLPKIAAGSVMVAVAVTEPDVGSDVAKVSCKADAAFVDGKEGYVLNGAKAWCTFAGRADILALLARTDPDHATAHKGLSLFIVEKDPFTGHEFRTEQPGGGTLSGKADPTLGYRGMHSFTLQFENYFVPAENLVGGADGVGRGFYLQMDGFAAGRLQTGGRATGLAQACLETTIRYVTERPQFGRPLSEYQNTEYEIGYMTIHTEAARQLTYAAARSMDSKDQNAGLLAAMAKRLACRVAVDVSQRGQVLHGGWGYSEEFAISRYVVDALVLPIFEGVEPILDLKVIGRSLLSRP